MFAFAHNIRSDLRTVVTRIQLVQRGTDSHLSEDDRNMLQESVKAADNISSLLSSMLTLTNPEMDAGESTLRLAIQGALIEMKPVLAAAQARVENLNCLEVPVSANMKRVLTELIANACTFRNNSRPLVISIETEMTGQGTLQIAVSDNGLGVPSEYIEQIFTPFQRLHSRNDFPGHGLGLSICRRIIENLGGTIDAAAKPEGLNVIVRLPVPE
jgi:signal transduction histidine kinase